jgi:outer membrane immunogenic protein
MRNTLLASASAIALGFSAASPVHAAPPAPAFSWTGFYLGANLGGATGGSNPSLIANITADPFDNFSTAGVPTLDVKGFVGGGQFGYNIQAGNYLYGFEADFTGMDVHGNTSVSPFFTGKVSNNFDWSSRYSWLSTIRARGGILIAPNWLVYGTGGLAITSVHDNVTCTSSSTGCGDITPFSPQNLQWSQTSTLVGWTAGGGIEATFLQNWIFGLKVLYARFPSTSPGYIGGTNGGAGPVPAIFSFDHNLTLVTFVVDYKFGGP